MILTGQNLSTWNKICSRATSCITDFTWTGPGIEPGKLWYVVGDYRLSRTAIQRFNFFYTIHKKIIPYLTEKKFSLYYAYWEIIGVDCQNRT